MFRPTHRGRQRLTLAAGDLFFLIAFHDFLGFLRDDFITDPVPYYQPADRLIITDDSAIAWHN